MTDLHTQDIHQGTNSQSTIDQSDQVLSRAASLPAPRGRSAATNTPNRFEPLHLEIDPAIEHNLIDPKQLRQEPTLPFAGARRPRRLDSKAIVRGGGRAYYVLLHSLRRGSV